MYKYSKFFLIAIFLVFLFVFFWKANIKNNYSINSSSTVVKQIKALNRYETAVYSIEKIIDTEKNGNTFQKLLYGDRILLIANGQVYAGFDLSNLSEKDVVIDKDTITVKLPKPQILVTKLDSGKTRVYDRKLGLLTKGDKDLESQARTEAEKSIQQAACDSGILDEASKNAKNQFTILFKSLRFSSIIITIPKGEC